MDNKLKRLDRLNGQDKRVDSNKSFKAFKQVQFSHAKKPSRKDYSDQDDVIKHLKVKPQDIRK